MHNGEICPDCREGYVEFKEKYAECNICGHSFPYLKENPDPEP